MGNLGTFAVTDVDSFDQSFENYLSSPFGFRRTKYSNQLGCANYDSVDYTLQYERTFLVGPPSTFRPGPQACC